MSADPFANTTTVKNILQHVVSPKIVIDGNGGYVTKTDLVNVHNIVFDTSEPTGSDGSSTSKPYTSQSGIATALGARSGVAAQNSITVYHARMTANSKVMCSVIGYDGNGPMSIKTCVVTGNGDNSGGRFRLTFSASPAASTTITIAWFILKF